MAMIEWQPYLSVGITAMDLQHKQLVALINQYAEAMRTKSNEQITRNILPGLVHYTKSHFRDEERMMEAIHYPNLIAHQQLHRRLTKDLETMIVKIHGGDSMAILKLGSFLRDWLVRHIQGDDKQYGEHVRSKHLQTV